MKRTLGRLLHVRALLEDISWLDFERETADMRSLEMAAARQRQSAFRARADALLMLGKSESGYVEWHMRIADAEILSWREAKLDGLAEAKQPAVSKAREELLTRRLERRQVEALLSAAESAEKKEQVRREQNRTDDWFQGRSAGRSQKRK